MYSFLFYKHTFDVHIKYISIYIYNYKILASVDFCWLIYDKAWSLCFWPFHNKAKLCRSIIMENWHVYIYVYI